MSAVNSYVGDEYCVPCPKCGCADIELSWMSIRGDDKWSYPSAYCTKCEYEVGMPFIRDETEAECRVQIVAAWNVNAAETKSIGRELTYQEAMALAHRVGEEAQKRRSDYYVEEAKRDG